MRTISCINDERLILVSDWKYDFVMSYCDTWKNLGKAIVGLRGVILARLIIGALNKPAWVLVDHKDRDIFNCQDDNLRISTHSQSACNVRKRSDAITSKYKGVSFERAQKIWLMQITKNGNRVKLRFETEQEAALSYNEHAKQLHGGFAVLNQVKKV